MKINLFKKHSQLLSIVSFRYYIVGAFLATLASGSSYIVMTWLVADSHHALTQVASLILCFWLPVVFLGPFFGVLADRYSRKKIIVIGALIRGLFLIGFGIFFLYQFSVVGLYLLMVLLGVAFSIYLPALMGLVRQLVSKEELLSANSMVDVAYEMGNVLGMGGAGYFLKYLTPEQIILLAGIFSCISAYIMSRMQLRVPDEEEASVDQLLNQSQEGGPLKKGFNDFASGIKYLYRSPGLLLICGIQLIIFLALMSSPVLLVPFAKYFLKMSVSEFGYIEAALSIGVITGAFSLSALVARLGLYRVLFTLCFSLVVCFALFGINHYVWGAIFLYFCIGFSLASWPLLMTRIQVLTALSYQSRVQSAVQSLGGLLVLIVYLLIQKSSHFIPITYFYFFESLLLFCVILILLLKKRLFQKSFSISTSTPSANVL